MEVFLHRLNIVFWTPIMFVFGTFLYLLAAPFFSGEVLYKKIKEHW